MQETSFGRASVARSQDFVLDSAYAEVLRTFNTATAISFDPAGRPMTISLEGETEDFSLAAHLEALVAHTAPGIIDSTPSELR